MKKVLFNCCTTLLAAFILAGCATNFTRMSVATVDYSTRTVNSFLSYEKENRALLWATAPEIKHTADFLRVHYPGWNAHAWDMIAAYRQGKTNEDAVARAVSVVEAAASTASAALFEYQRQTVTP
jgi:hypothetical protein